MKIRLNDFTTAYEERGSGRPVLFIHGFPLNRKMWKPQIEAFSDQVHVIAPDLRGHGETEAVPGPYSMEMLADDCHSLLQSLGVTQPVILCGLSMGGYITLAFYRKYPELAAGLILAATRAGADSEEGKTNRENAAAQAQEKGVTAIIDGMLPKILAPRTYENNPDLVDRVRDIMAQTSVEGVVGAQFGMKDRPDSTELLRGIRVPTLVVHGAEDQIIPAAEAEAMHAAIPGSQILILPDSGHLLNLEQPERFNQALAAFLASLD
jgi:pimeloyl-ACP methyl ester carboxylesterase